MSHIQLDGVVVGIAIICVGGAFNPRAGFIGLAVLAIVVAYFLAHTP